MWLQEVDEESAESKLGLVSATFLLGFWWEKDDLL